MAFAAQLAGLTEELVAAVCPELLQARANALRDASLKALRRHTYTSTNQFLVQEQLEGLQEKFIINGRDALAAALRERLDRLTACSTKFTPEVLHLLLELSDQPLQRSHLGHLDAAQEQVADNDVQLQWEDISKEDEWSRDQPLWENVDFGASSSSEDESYQEDEATDAAPSDSEGSSVLEIPPPVDRIFLDPQLDTHDSASLEDVIKSQSWRLEPVQPDHGGLTQSIYITESQAVREVLFMLQGYQTTLFNDRCEPILAYRISEVSLEVCHSVFASVAEMGRPLRPLRAFAQSRQDVPLLQMFQDCVRNDLQAFDHEVSLVQSLYADVGVDVVVSLLAVVEQVKPRVAPLSTLGAIVQRLRQERQSHAFRHLELLFEAACALQVQGDMASFRALASTFLKCFQVYLRPIRLWMDEGQLLPNDKIFFIAESGIKVPLNQIWQSKFKLRQTVDGRLHAPRFLQFAVARIYTTGKSVVVLKHLGKYDAVDRCVEDGHLNLDLAHICPPHAELAPFSELFGEAFDKWIKGKHRATSATLQKILFESGGLWSTLDAFQQIYLMADGAASDLFTSAVFGKMDRMQASWHDRFTLTELAQEAFSALTVDRIWAFVDTKDADPKSINLARSRSMVRDSLPGLKLHFRMAWPVQMILTRDCVEKYQRIYTVMLQLRRAIYVLNRHRLLLGGGAAAGSRSEAAYYRLRARLLWFCNTLMTYLTTLVFTPNMAALEKSLSTAEDVDGMIGCHSVFIAAMLQESCLEPRLDPIRECVLDVLDLTVELEDARRRNADGAAREPQGEPSTPTMVVGAATITGVSPADFRKSRLRGLYVSPEEKEDEDDTGAEVCDEDDEDETNNKNNNNNNNSNNRRKNLVTRLGNAAQPHETYWAALRRISADFDRHLRFVTGGLRGVARASSHAAAAKWDILAEMLEAGMIDQR